MLDIRPARLVLYLPSCGISHKPEGILQGGQIPGKPDKNDMNPTYATQPVWKPGEFQIHFIHTGVAESMFLIFPDSTTMLLDCGDQAAITRGKFAVPVLPNPGRLAGEWIARYVRRVNPNGADVDWLVVSHFHSDHAGIPSWQKYPRIPDPDETPPLEGCIRSGIGLAAETLRFRRATDRGFPDYNDPLPLPSQNEPAVVAGLLRDVWEALRRRDGLVAEPFRLGATDQFVAERGVAPGFSVRNICANGRLAMPDGSIRDLYAERIARDHPASLNENAMSLGMVFSYGAFRFCACGDFSDRFTAPDGREVFIEDELGGCIGHCHAAKLNHHGHHSTGRVLAAAIRPLVWIAPVWDQLHLTDDTAESLLIPGAPDSEQPLLVPTVLPVTDAGPRPWWRFVPEPCRTGCHVVLSVPPGGETFTMTLLDARDEEMRVTAVCEFETEPSSLEKKC